MDLYNQAVGGNVITQSIYQNYQSPACVFVSQPTVVGNYTLVATIAALASITSPVQVVSNNAARLLFSRSTMTIGNGMDSGPYGVLLSRQGYPDVAFDISQPLTVAATSSDPTRVTVPAVTIPAGVTQTYFVLNGVAATAGSPVTIDATSTGYDAPLPKLAVNVVDPELSMNSFDGTRSRASPRDDFWVQLTVPGVDAITGSVSVPLTVDLAATDIGTNLARTATPSASSTGNTAIAADVLNDGLRDVGFSTRVEAHAWWQADLGTAQAFDRVYVHFGNGASRIAILTASQPFVDSDFSGATLPTTFSNGATLIYQSGVTETDPLVVTGTFNGRYVRVVGLDPGSLTLSEVELFQGGGGASGIVSFYDAATGGSPVTQATILAGQNAVSVYVGEPTGTGSYVVSAGGAGFSSVTSPSQVVNLPLLTLQNLNNVPEPNAVVPFQVLAPFLATSDTTVTLTSSNTAVATISSPTAVIPAGSNTSATINFNALTEGVTLITATAPGFHPLKIVVTVSFPVPF